MPALQQEVSSSYNLNVSDPYDSSYYEDVQPQETDYKVQLRVQLNDLQSHIKSMKSYNDFEESQARRELNKKVEKSEPKSESGSYRNHIEEMKTTLAGLINKVEQVEVKIQRENYDDSLSTFKTQILQELRTPRSNTSKKSNIYINTALSPGDLTTGPSTERKPKFQIEHPNNRVSDLLSLIQQKTELKIRKIRELQTERLKTGVPTPRYNNS